VDTSTLQDGVNEWMNYTGSVGSPSTGHRVAVSDQRRRLRVPDGVPLVLGTHVTYVGTLKNPDAYAGRPISRKQRADVLDSKPKRTFVLIPGAWMGGWSWQPVARLLAEGGYPVLTLTLPGLSYDGSPAGLGLADAIDYVVGEVERRDLTDVVLVCHSWGGYPATGAAHRLAGRVRKVIYHSAVVPERDRAMADENEQYGEIIRQAVTAGPDRTVPIGLDAISGGLMPGEPAPLQEFVSRMLVPQPGGYMLDSLDVPPVTKTGLNAAYVLCADDVALARPGAEFAARLGVEPVVVPGHHLTLLTRPGIVADALLSLL
jgi:pimeloyl-ACP methyl ester carboxylesterase